MNGVTVGRLERARDQALRFYYADSWLSNDYARPISLSLPLSTRTYVGENVYNFFDNLLPDNAAIRAKIQARFHAASSHAFDLLSSVGRDCIGAVQLIGDDEVLDYQSMSYSELSEQEVSHLLGSYREAPLGMSDEYDDFRISLAGAQEKTALLYHNHRWCLPHGTTATSHILKLPMGVISHQNIDLRDSCENEWLCAKIVNAFGLPVAECDVKNIGGTKVLVVERFDRRLSSDKSRLIRLPQEDLCQALGISPQLKYQSDGGPGIDAVMQLLLGSQQAASDRRNFFKSQVIFWCLAAIDGHGKNFSVHIEAQGRYRLTPFYDILSAYPMIASKQLQARKIKMAMALRGQNSHYHWYPVQRRHFISTAKSVNYSAKLAVEIIDEVIESIDPVIARVESQLPREFPVEIADAIFNGMRSFKRRLML